MQFRSLCLGTCAGSCYCARGTFLQVNHGQTIVRAIHVSLSMNFSSTDQYLRMWNFNRPAPVGCLRTVAVCTGRVRESLVELWNNIYIYVQSTFVPVDFIIPMHNRSKSNRSFTRFFTILLRCCISEYLNYPIPLLESIPEANILCIWDPNRWQTPTKYWRAGRDSVVVLPLRLPSHIQQALHVPLFCQRIGTSFSQNDWHRLGGESHGCYTWLDTSRPHLVPVVL